MLYDLQTNELSVEWMVVRCIVNMGARRYDQDSVDFHCWP